MIRPTRRAILFAAAGFPAALVPVLLGGGLWPAWAGVAAAFALALGLELALLTSPRRIDLSAAMPESLRIGQEGRLVVMLGVRRGPALRIGVLPELGEGLAPAAAAEVLAPPGGRAEAAFPLAPARRGTVDVAAIWLRWPGRLGLLRREHRREVGRRIAVVLDLPRARAEALRFQAGRDGRSGTKAMNFVGEGSEFDALREFVPGFDRRSLDWKASARHRRLLGREYRAERDHQVVLALDTGHLMGEHLDGMPRLDHALHAALALGAVALRSGDLVGLQAFDEKPRVFLRPEAGLGTMAVLQRAAAGLAARPVETNFTWALTELGVHVRRRSLIVLFTDFTDSVTAGLMAANLDRLARRHVVLFVALRDPEPERVALAEPRSLRAIGRAVVAAELVREREVVLARLRRSGVLCADVSAREVGVELVNRYLDIKRRERV